MEFVHNNHIEQIPEMSSRIGRVIYIPDVALDEGVGTGNAFLVKGLFTPFTFNGAKMCLKALSISFVVDFGGHVSPLSDTAGVVGFFAGAHMDFNIIVPFSWKWKDGEWKKSKLEKVKNYILAQL